MTLVHAASCSLSAGGCCCGGCGVLLFTGTRMFVMQLLHRTVFPRRASGTESTLRHVKFGHMMRTQFVAIGVREAALRSYR